MQPNGGMQGQGGGPFSLQQALAVPPGLNNVPAPLLEEYVQARISRFLDAVVQRLLQHEPQLNLMSVQRAISEVASGLPPATPLLLQPPLMPDVAKVVYQLVFRHDCLALGCLDPQCTLCQHNPQRRCTVNFDRKYLVNDVLKARCGAQIRVEITDAATGNLMEAELPGLKLEVCVLDGHAYDTKFVEGGRSLEGGQEPEDELEACVLLLNKKKNTPLLVSGSTAANDSQGRLVLQLQHGRAALPEVSITDSSEAILLGRKPPFRLLVRAIWATGGAGTAGSGAAMNGGPMGGLSRSASAGPPGVVIRHAISEGFVVATRRTRTAGKVDIPSVDDPVGKLEHMGKETVKKLSDIRSAAVQAGVDISIPENSVTKVGEFKQLALRADQDGHLRQRLQHVLKLSKEKWDEAREHALRAVVADARFRAWYADPHTCALGLLFSCRMGSVDLDRPQALLQMVPVAATGPGNLPNGSGGGGGAAVKLEATLMAHLSPAQRDLVRQLLPRAAHSWWGPGHPGWAIFTTPPDADALLLGVLAALSAQLEGSGGPSGPPIGPPPAIPLNAATSGMGMGLPLRSSSGAGSLANLQVPPALPMQLTSGGGVAGLLALPGLSQSTAAGAPGGLGVNSLRVPSGSQAGGINRANLNPFGQVARGGAGSTMHMEASSASTHGHAPTPTAGGLSGGGGGGMGTMGGPSSPTAGMGGGPRPSSSSFSGAGGPTTSHLTKRSAHEMSTSSALQGGEYEGQTRARTTSALSAPSPPAPTTTTVSAATSQQEQQEMRELQEHQHRHQRQRSTGSMSMGGGMSMGGALGAGMGAGGVDQEAQGGLPPPLMAVPPPQPSGLGVPLQQQLGPGLGLPLHLQQLQQQQQQRQQPPMWFKTEEPLALQQQQQPQPFAQMAQLRGLVMQQQQQQVGGLVGGMGGGGRQDSMGPHGGSCSTAMSAPPSLQGHMGLPSNSFLNGSLLPPVQQPGPGSSGTGGPAAATQLLRMSTHATALSAGGLMQPGAQQLSGGGGGEGVGGVGAGGGGGMSRPTSPLPTSSGMLMPPPSLLPQQQMQMQQQQQMEEPPNPFASIAAAANVVANNSGGATGGNGGIGAGAGGQGGQGPMPFLGPVPQARTPMQQHQQQLQAAPGGAAQSQQQQQQQQLPMVAPSFDLSALPSLPSQSQALQTMLGQMRAGTMGAPAGGAAAGAAAGGGAGGAGGGPGDVLKGLPSFGVGSFLNSTELDAMLGNLGGGGGPLPDHMETSLTSLNLMNSLQLGLLGNGSSASWLPPNLFAPGQQQLLLQQAQQAAQQLQQPPQGQQQLQGAQQQPQGQQGQLPGGRAMAEGVGGSAGQAGGGNAAGASGGLRPGAGPGQDVLQGCSSGLDNMQSIEQALPEISPDMSAAMLVSAQQHAAQWHSNAAARQLSQGQQPSG